MHAHRRSRGHGPGAVFAASSGRPGRGSAQAGARGCVQRQGRERPRRRWRTGRAGVLRGRSGVQGGVSRWRARPGGAGGRTGRFTRVAEKKGRREWEREGEGKRKRKENGKKKKKERKREMERERERAGFAL